MYMLHDESPIESAERTPTLTAESAGLRQHVRILAYKGCQFTMDLLNAIYVLNRDHGDCVSSELELVQSLGQARMMGLYGSPTILVDGREYQDWWRGPAGLYCRAYVTPHGFRPYPDLDDLLSGRDHLDELTIRNRGSIEPVYPTLFAANWCPQSQATRRFWQEAAGIAGCRLRVLDVDSSEGARQMLRMDVSGVPCLMASPTRFVYGTPASLTRAADFLKALHDRRSK